jgi:hypothetical protein
LVVLRFLSIKELGTRFGRFDFSILFVMISVARFNLFDYSLSYLLLKTRARVGYLNNFGSMTLKQKNLPIGRFFCTDQWEELFCITKS